MTPSDPPLPPLTLPHPSPEPQPSLAQLRHTLEQCNHCGQCKWIPAQKTQGVDFAQSCPIHQHFHFDAYSGQGLLNIAQEVLEGTLELTPALVEMVYTCTTCGACDTNCKSIRDMEVLESILALRRHLVERGVAPLPAHRMAARNIEREHNIFGRPHAERAAWLAGQPAASARAAILYYVGDQTAYRYPQIARDTARILRAAGVEFAVLGHDEWSDGGLLWRTGQAAAAEVTARHNIAAINASGATLVLCSDAESLSVMRDFYPRLDALQFRTQHTTELFAQLLSEGRLRLTRAIDRTVTFHDSCFLGRLSEPYEHWQGEIQAFNRHVPPKQFRRGTYGVYDAPRSVLSAIPGLKLVEMVRHEEAAFCCGAGGGVAESDPQFAIWSGRERLREAQAARAQTIVCGAPRCQANLAAAAASDHPAVVDITELIIGAL